MANVSGSRSPAVADDDRWPAAESILDGRPTAWARQRTRRVRRLILAIPVGAAVIGGGIGALVGAAAGKRGHQVHPPEPGGWQLGAGLTLAAVGLVVMFTGVVLLWRSAGWQPIWRSPVVVLTRRQRAHLSKEVRGRTAADPRHRRIAHYLARRIADQRGLLPLLVGTMIMFLGLLIAMPSPWRLIYTLAILLLDTAASVSVIRGRRQARRFLEQQPDLTGPAAR